MTANQDAHLQERRRQLRKHIARLRPLQTVYMPGVGLRIDRQSADNIVHPAEAVPLWLPSALTRAERGEICQPGLADMEEQLRQGQCFDALHKLRNMLRARTHFIKHKNANVRSQRRTTRALALIDGVKANIDAQFNRYTTSRAALLALRGPGDWETVLRELKKEDLRAPSAAEFGIEDTTSRIGPDGRPLPRRAMVELERQLGEGYRVISWIWHAGVTMTDTSGDEADELNQGTLSCLWCLGF